MPTLLILFSADLDIDNLCKFCKAHDLRTNTLVLKWSVSYLIVLFCWGGVMGESITSLITD